MNENNKEYGVIYARYSSNSQNEATIEKQIEECKKYAEKNGISIINEYIDRAHTGTNFNRPAFKQMLFDSDKHSFSKILVYALNRLGRKASQTLSNIEEFNKKGITVLSITERSVGSKNPADSLFCGIITQLDQYYSEELSQKIRYGNRQAAEKGLALGGRGIFGYNIENRRYVINEQEAQTVRLIFNMYVFENKTRAEIIRYLNNNNIKTKAGNKFNDRAIETILKNQKYIGDYIFCGENLGKTLPRIIEDDTFFRAEKILEVDRKAPARKKDPDECYSLTSKLYCGECGRPMHGMSGHSKTHKAIYRYYSCKNHKYKDCQMKNIRMDYIETLVINETMALLTNENIKIIAKKVNEMSKQSNSGSKLDNLKNEKKEIEKSIKNIIKAIEQGSTSKILLDQLESRENELSNIDKLIVKEKCCNNIISEESVILFLNSFVNGDIKNSTIRKALVDILINKVIIAYNEEGNKKITVICNAYNGSNNVTFDFFGEGSRNIHFGGDEGD